MRLGGAIRRVRETAALTQEQLAGELETTQATVSRWERGVDEPSVEMILALEEACQAPAGSVYSAAGLVALPTVEAALFADQELTPAAVESILVVYRAHKTRGSSSRGRGTTSRRR